MWSYYVLAWREVSHAPFSLLQHQTGACSFIKLQGRKQWSMVSEIKTFQMNVFNFSTFFLLPNVHHSEFKDMSNHNGFSLKSLLNWPKYPFPKIMTKLNLIVEVDWRLESFKPLWIGMLNAFNVVSKDKLNSIAAQACSPESWKKDCGRQRPTKAIPEWTNAQMLHMMLHEDGVNQFPDIWSSNLTIWVHCQASIATF